MPFKDVQTDFTIYSAQKEHRSTFSHFQEAGIDVFASIGSQSPAGYFQLTNVLPSINGGFLRRWGTRTLGQITNGSLFGPSLTRLFSYQIGKQTLGSIVYPHYYAILGTDGQIVKPVYAEGSVDFTSVISGFSGTGDLFGVDNDGTFYAFDGIGTPVKKSFQAGTLSSLGTQTNIGIAKPTNFLAVTGVQFAGIVPPYPFAEGIGTGANYNPGTTTASITGSGSGCTLDVQIGAGGTVVGVSVINPGTGYGANGSETTVTISDSSGLGSGAYVVPNINSAGNIACISLDGPMVFAVGRLYAVAFQNSTTGHTSDIAYSAYSPLSYTTGPIYSQTINSATSDFYNLGVTQILANLFIWPAPTDPQIDTVVLMAASDGGTEELMYEVATFPLSDFVPTTGVVTSFTGVASDEPPQSRGYSYFLQSQGPGNTSAGDVVTVYYSDSTNSGPDTALVTAYNSGTPVFIEFSFEGTGSTIGPYVVQVTGVGEGNPPGQPRAFYYFTFQVANSAYTYYPGSGHAGYIANYQQITIPSGVTLPPVGALTYNFVDTLPDTYSDFTGFKVVDTLLGQNLWVDTDAYMDVIGIFNNIPPTPNLNKPVIHQGRMFATDGQSVFFSKSIDEVTTSTGLITSVWGEAWPAGNQLDIVFDNEVITGLLSDTTFLYIGTTQNIYRLSGTSANNFAVECIFRNVGVVSQDCWTVIYKNNSPAGYMWVTPDGKIMLSDFNSYRDVAVPIYPLVPTVLSGLDIRMQPWVYGPYSLVLVKINNGDLFVFNANTETWYQWVVSIGSGPFLTYVNSSGLPNPFFVANSYNPGEGGYPTTLGYFDPTVAVDANFTGGTGTTNIPWVIQTGWMDMSDDTFIKVVNELECWSGETNLQTSVYSTNYSRPITSSTVPLPTPQTRTAIPGPIASMSGVFKAPYAAQPTGGKFLSFQIGCDNPGTSFNVLDQFVVSYYPFGRF